MSDRRVVITGLGVIAPNGIGKEKFWDALVNGVSGITKITRFDASNYPTQIAGEVKDFNPESFIDHKQLKRLHRSSQFAVVASKLALEDAQLKIETNEERERTGVILGTSIGGQGWIYDQHLAFLRGGYRKINPFTSIAVYPNACSAEVSIALSVQGPSETFSFGCSSPLSAGGSAYHMLRSNLVDIMIIGGAEAPLESPIFAALCMSGNLSTRNDEPQKASRPFDKKRDGLVVSEGAGVLVLEELEHAKRRGVHIYAEIVGWGETCDAYHPFIPHPSAVQPARAIELALKQAQCKPKDINYICALGLSLSVTDIAETKAIKKVFGAEANKIPISSIKSMIGQPFAAAGALQMITSVLTIENKVIPPTINYELPDPECDLDYVPNHNRKADISYSLTETFAFGGKNVALVFKKYP